MERIMSRTTSRIAYNQINASGIASTQKERILNYIKGRKDSSLREIQRDVGMDINAVSGRVNDLKSEGELEERNKRKCSITNRLITPVAIKRKEPQMEIFY